MQAMTAYYEYRHTVTPDEIDELDHAGNFHYVIWMQHAAVAHSMANGWPPERYFELGAGWVVRSHQITYVKPAFVGDDLVIRTWVASVRSAVSVRKYDIHRADGELLARAETAWAFISYRKQRPTRIPPEVAECFELAPDP